MTMKERIEWAKNIAAKQEAEKFQRMAEEEKRLLTRAAINNNTYTGSSGESLGLILQRAGITTSS